MSTNLLQGIAPDGTIRAVAVGDDGSLLTNGDSSGGNALLYEQVLNAPDLYKSINYLDAGTPDERIANITISSSSLNVEFYDNYTYSGTSGNYRVITVARTQGIAG